MRMECDSLGQAYFQSTCVRFGSVAKPPGEACTDPIAFKRHHRDRPEMVRFVDHATGQHIEFDIRNNLT